jgi:hypothetical protein
VASHVINKRREEQLQAQEEEKIFSIGHRIHLGSRKLEEEIPSFGVARPIRFWYVKNRFVGSLWGREVVRWSQFPGCDSRLPCRCRVYSHIVHLAASERLEFVADQASSSTCVQIAVRLSAVDEVVL